jgi:hypothetical protein
MQTPLKPVPFTQLEPWPQSRLSKQVFEPFPVSLFMGTLSLSLSEGRNLLQAPSMHAVPGMQSVSNWQEAKAGVEVRQRMVTTIRLRIVVALLEGWRRVRREW